MSSSSKLTREERADVIARLQTFFLKERDEELGALPADLMVDFIEREIAPYFHNHGIHAAKREVSKLLDATQDALDVLELRPQRKR